MGPRGLVTARLYPDLLETEKRKKVPFLIKDAMDIVFSASALLVFSPVFLLLALIIKLTSKGPVSSVKNESDNTACRLCPEIPVHAHFE